MILTNLRQIHGRHGLEMAADFEIEDGRVGSVTIPLAEYEQHGQRALEQEASACEAFARTHGYRAPEADRYRELG